MGKRRGLAEEPMNVTMEEKNVKEQRKGAKESPPATEVVVSGARHACISHFGIEEGSEAEANKIKK